MKKDERVEAWCYNPSDEDQRLPHQFVPNRPVPAEYLDELGVLTLNLDADKWQADPELEQLKQDRGYNYWDEVTVAPGAMKDYDAKIHHFYQEHLHADEEIRFVLDGSAYFDVRDLDDKTWIRFRISKGDLIVLPAGMYHRFTLDTNNYIRALRLFKGLPCWTQHQRPADHMSARKDYLEYLEKFEADDDNAYPTLVMGQGGGHVAVAASS